MKIGKLFVGMQQTNEDNNYTLASWAHPSGYWRWSIWLRRHKVPDTWSVLSGAEQPLPTFGFGPSKACGTRYTLGSLRNWWWWFGAWMHIAGIGTLSILTQPPAPRDAAIAAGGSE